ncbi:helix-turn-helix domain-containing protein [Sphaerisporangium sp. TRM90804]|uniref:ArsR/SmtB family transcription factor n=1 Tax=Sphaerisporangium sp. TRM90804 TaxID=3031113 RepID=UPI002447C8AE|nr:helix-turn-helix domain-containing protein [Sphaerisporangium sp. TRM90804]MDH2430398.1 helix-turn-helix domain-containing protein [Sphaerisporangium sp. TRM90804]
MVIWGRMDAMEQRLAALEGRVGRLEAGAVAQPKDRVGGRSSGDAPLRLLDRLREHIEGPDDGQQPGPSEATGAIAYAGAVGRDGREYMWAKQRPVQELTGAERSGTAALLECLGSPARLALLTALVGTSRTRTQLQEALGETTSTGHLYHHLRGLQAVGLLIQPRRGEYELAAHAVVPLLTIIAATLDLTTGSGHPVEESGQ